MAPCASLQMSKGNSRPPFSETLSEKGGLFSFNNKLTALPVHGLHLAHVAGV